MSRASVSKEKSRKYVTATGEIFYTDDAGIEYFIRMASHIRGQYQQVEELKKEVAALKKIIV